jgi:hypothetical protein
MTILVKRVTLSLYDEIYSCLVDYAKDSSKNDLTRFNVSKATRKLLQMKFGIARLLPKAFLE